MEAHAVADSARVRFRRQQYIAEDEDKLVCMQLPASVVHLTSCMTA